MCDAIRSEKLESFQFKVENLESNFSEGVCIFPVFIDISLKSWNPFFQEMKKLNPFFD